MLQQKDQMTIHPFENFLSVCKGFLDFLLQCLIVIGHILSLAQWLQLAVTINWWLV